MQVVSGKNGCRRSIGNIWERVCQGRNVSPLRTRVPGDQEADSGASQLREVANDFWFTNPSRSGVAGYYRRGHHGGARGAGCGHGCSAVVERTEDQPNNSRPRLSRWQLKLDCANVRTLRPGPSRRECFFLSAPLFFCFSSFSSVSGRCIQRSHGRSTRFEAY